MSGRDQGTWVGTIMGGVNKGRGLNRYGEMSGDRLENMGGYLSGGGG